MRAAGWIAIGLVAIAVGMVVPLVVGWVGWDRAHVNSSAMSRYALILAIVGTGLGYMARRTRPARIAMLVGVVIVFVLAVALAG